MAKKGKRIGIGDSDQRHLLYLAARCLTQIRISRRAERPARPKQDPGLAARQEDVRATIDRITTDYVAHWLTDAAASDEKLFPEMDRAWGGLVGCCGRFDAHPVLDWLIAQLESPPLSVQSRLIVLALRLVVGQVRLELAAQISEVLVEKLVSKGHFRVWRSDTVQALRVAAEHFPEERAARIVEVLCESLMSSELNRSDCLDILEALRVVAERVSAQAEPIARMLLGNLLVATADGVGGPLAHFIGRHFRETSSPVCMNQSARLIAESEWLLREAIAERLGDASVHVSEDQSARIAQLLQERLVCEPKDRVRAAIAKALGKAAGNVPKELVPGLADLLLDRLASEPEDSVRSSIIHALDDVAARVPAQQATLITEVLLGVMRSGTGSEVPHAVASAGVRWRQKLGRPRWVSHVRLLSRGAVHAAQSPIWRRALWFVFSRVGRLLRKCSLSVQSA